MEHPTQRKGICSFADTAAIEVMLNFGVFFTFIPYVATVLMKLFYDEALLKTLFQTLLRFSAGIG